MKSIRLLQILAACPVVAPPVGMMLAAIGLDVAGGVCHGARLAAHHEGQRPGLCAAHAARDRGVHEAEAGGSGGVVQFLGGRDVDGGGVHQQRPGVGVGQDAVLAEVHGPGVLALGQHGEHDVGAVHGLGDAADRLTPASSAAASAAGLRSNPRTSCPAFTRFADMEPPMFPRPIQPITAMS